MWGVGGLARGREFEIVVFVIFGMKLERALFGGGVSDTGSLGSFGGNGFAISGLILLEHDTKL